ncbi:MAG TPA: type II toxin-antitoxin system RelE/ParE family toxin [Clostridiales bacterium]|nr:type II toxin-antitoxin system RelE/ParE family toxin [Clostridiales bacterium]
MYKRFVSELAHGDLRNIVAYIKDTLCAPEAAAAFLDEIKKCYARLVKNPLIYALCNDERLAKEGYRKASIKNYLLIFKADETSNVVTIYRFFYGAEEYQNKL